LKDQAEGQKGTKRMINLCQRVGNKEYFYFEKEMNVQFGLIVTHNEGQTVITKMESNLN